MALKFNPITGKLDVVYDKASQIGIVDGGGYYNGGTVEIALQEIGDGTTLNDLYVNVTGDTMTGSLHLNDDICVTFGNTLAAPNASICWDTTDANANMLKVNLPAGDATDVPVLAIGSGIEGVDLGLFDGSTEATTVFLKTDLTEHVKIRYEAATIKLGIFGMVIGASDNTRLILQSGNEDMFFQPSQDGLAMDANFRATSNSKHCGFELGEPNASTFFMRAMQNYDECLYAGSIATGRQFLFTDTLNRDRDHDIPVMTDNTVAVYSFLNPNTDHSEVCTWQYQGLRCGEVDNVDWISSSFEMETDRATYDFTISAVNAFNSAAANANPDGASLILKGGNGAVDDTVAANGGDIQLIPGDRDSAGNGTIGALVSDRRTVFTPSATQNITAGGGIEVTNTIMNIQGSGGDVIVTANPQIKAGTNGELLVLEGKNDSQTVEISDGTGVHTHGMAKFYNKDKMLMMYDSAASEWIEIARNFPEFETTFGFSAPAGSFGTFYSGGSYEFGATDNNFNPAINLGTANRSLGSHVFFVQAAGGGGGTDTVVRVSGTSIGLDGTRTAADTEDVTIDDAGAANTFYQTTKRWLGQVALTKQSGPDLLCNYGLANFWNNHSENFRVTGVHVYGLAGANDANPNILLRHHKATGWTYNAGAAPTPPAAIADMNTDHNTEIQFFNDEPFSWERTNLGTAIDGGNGEGVIAEWLTTANKAVNFSNFILRARNN